MKTNTTVPIMTGAALLLFVALTLGPLTWQAYLQAQELPSVLVEFNGPEPELAPAAIGIVLTAPETCEVGELVHFDASSSDVDSLTWDILPYTPDFKVVANTGAGGIVYRSAFFSARAKGEWVVIIAGAKDGQAFLSHMTISAGKKPPGKFKNLVEKLEGKK